MTRRRILLAEIVAKVPQASVPATFAGGVLTKSVTGYTGPGAASNWLSTIEVSAGQWYWETTITYTGTGNPIVGIAGAGNGAVPFGQPQVGSGIVMSAGIGRSGTAAPSGVSVGGTIASGSIIRSWLDMDAKVYRVAVNGGPWVVIASLDTWWPQYLTPAVVPAPFRSLAVGISLLGPDAGGSSSATANFGASPFAYAVPDGVNPGVYTVPAAVPISIHLSCSAFATDSLQYDARIAGDNAADVETDRQGSCYVWGSQSVSRRGKLVVINADGALDAWETYEWRDAPVTLLRGYEGDAIGAFSVESVNRVDSIAFTAALRVELTFADPLVLLDRAMQTALYPEDQPNAQLAGKPVPIVYGAPMYCTAARLDTSALVRDHQLHDGVGVPLLRIESIYDRGDLFGGPDDPFTAHNAITGGNGGDFTGWAGSPSVPTGWTALTPYGAADRFLAGGGGGCRAQSHHNPSTAIQHGVVLNAGERYQITFTAAAVPTPGILTFAAGNVTVPFAAATGGAKTVVIDVVAAAKLEIRLDGTPLDATITTLRAASVQVIDWTYYRTAGQRTGFTLANTAAGKVVANPVSELHSLLDIVNDVCSTRLALPAAGALPAIDTATVNAASAGYILAKYIDSAITALAFLREVMDSHCGWLTSNRLGQIVFGRVTAPSNTAVLTLDQTNVLGEIEATDDLAKGLTIRLSGRRNNSPHADGDLADSVTPAMRVELQTEMTLTRTGAPLLGATAVSAAYVQAVNAPARATLLQLGADLQREANRIATLWRPARKFYSLTALLDASAADSLEPGQTVRVVWSRHGLANGRNLLVVGVRSRFFSRRVDLTLWG